jgi:serine/threonine-protein kinase
MSHEVREGDVLAGKFRIERVLGRGGMGVVVAATHLQLDERVALKFLLPEALENGEAVARFAREARAAVKIKSEHVARVSDVGTLESGSPYMVMEYLQGQDLADYVRDHGAMRVPDAIEFVLQACEALAEAHALGIVHRDLKPANLFVTARADGSPCIKVLDFGISKFTLPGSSNLDMTRTRALMGSPLYMSPEQMSSSRGVDARSDLWAIGVILYEILSGHVPFEAETMPQLCGLILEGSPRSLRMTRPDVPEAVEACVLRCLAKDRVARFANVAEFARALAPFGPPSATRSAERIARVLKTPGAVPLSDSGRAAVSATDNALALTAQSKSSGFRAVWFGALPVVGLLIGSGALLALRSPAVSAERVDLPQQSDARPLASSTPRAEVGPALAAPPLAAAPPSPVAQPAASASVSPSAGPTPALRATKSPTSKSISASAKAKTADDKSSSAAPTPAPASRHEDVFDDRQ